MSYGFASRSSWITALLVGVVTGAIVVGLAWWGTWRWSSPDPEPPPQPAVLHSGHAAGEPDRGTTRASRTTSERALCRSVYDEQQAPLDAAAASLNQWEVHVGAMNKLVVGAITLAQATQFWNQTREGAHARLHEFATASAAYDQRIFRCPAPEGAGRATSDLVACHRALAARGRTLRLAEVALGTWEQHVHHMDMLRSGEMTPDEATQLWLGSWRAGDRELRAYQDAARASAGLTC